MNQPGAGAGAWKWRLRCAAARAATPAQRLRAASRGGGPRGADLPRLRRAHGRAREHRDEILDVNRRYHDVAAAEYDAKWGVDFGAVGRAQVLGKVEKLLGRAPGPFARSLEIGAGTGYFTLNLLQAGVSRRRSAPTSRPGCSTRCARNAERLGLDVETVACDAAALPFEDASFDLVLGHAVLHHLPELDARVRGVRARAAARRDAAVRGRAVAPRRPASPPCPKRAGARGRAAVAAAGRRAARARRERTAGARRRRTTTRSSRSSTCTPSRRATSSATRRAPASPPCGCAARSCWPTGSAGSTARVEATARARRHPARLVPVRLPRLHRAAEGRPRGARAAPAARRASTT